MIPTRKIRILIYACLIFAASSCTLVPSEPSQVPQNTHTSTEPSSSATIRPSQTLALPTETTSPSATGTPPASPSASVPSETLTDVPTPDQRQAAQLGSQVQVVQFPYELQAGSPKYLPNFTRPSLGCNVQSVAGQVFDQNRNPVKLVVVNIQGVLNGRFIDNMGITGNTTAYGPGGYEVDLGTQPFASSDIVYLWLTDLQGIQISSRIYFDTYADCQKNLILINLQVTKPYKIFLPRIMR